uniref:Uncharacterized protein n=1 Tax=Panagrolaimus sp. JU765 TaxID=591449 RepID=A0AC34QZW6_9BILA
MASSQKKFKSGSGTALSTQRILSSSEVSTTAPITTRGLKLSQFFNGFAVDEHNAKRLIENQKKIIVGFLESNNVTFIFFTKIFINGQLKNLKDLSQSRLDLY